MRRARIAVALAVTAALLVACGSPSADAPVPGPPTPNPIVSAVTTSRSWGSATVVIDGAATVDGTTTTARGQGDVGLDKLVGLIRWSTPSGEFTELVNDQAVFRRVGDGLWTRTELRDGTDTSPLVDPLRGLSGAHVVSQTGTEDGGSTIEATLPVDTRSVASLAITPEDRARLVDRAPADAVMSIRLDVDPNHRITRIARTVDVGEDRATTTVDLSDFAVVLGVAPPPSSSVRP